MSIPRLLAEHLAVTRRHFLRLGLGTSASLAIGSRWADVAAGDDTTNAQLAEAIAQLGYFTPSEEFGTVERGDPLPYTLPDEKLREAGLTRETWSLEVVPDEEAIPKVENPLSKERGTALDWSGLMKLAETKAVRFLKILTCNNGG